MPKATPEGLMAFDRYYQTISPLIEASLSPVFLLSAIGVTLSVIDNRQNRIVDRLRQMETQILVRPVDSELWEEESAFYLERARRIGWAAALCIISALAVALSVVTLLLDAQTEVRLAILVEVAFTLAVTLYGMALVLFLGDVLQVNRGLAYVHRRVKRAIDTARPNPD
jgi:hypothetical protein